MYRILYAVFLSLTIAAFGCGKKNPNLPDCVSVTGTVTLDAKPIEGAVVYFMPTGDTRGVDAYGKTDSKGRYSLGSRKIGKGTPVGQYKVMICKAAPADGSNPGGKDFDPATSPSRELIPAKYSHRLHTTLTATVEDGGSEIDFDLTTK